MEVIEIPRTDYVSNNDSVISYYVINDYVFLKKQERAGSKYVYCRENGCNASATIENNNFVGGNFVHLHPAENTDNLRMQRACMFRAILEPLTFKEIVDQETLRKRREENEEKVGNVIYFKVDEDDESTHQRRPIKAEVSPNLEIVEENQGEEQNEASTSQSISTTQQGFTSENSMASSEECANEDQPPPASPQQFMHEEMGQTPPVNNFVPQRPESYKLSHNNHLNLVLESLAKDESFMDVTLTAQSKSVKAHKSVLSAVSAYFRNVLKENPCQHPIIIMPRDIKYQELCSIMNYIYKGEMTVAANDLSSLLKTADILQITGLSPADSNSIGKNNLSNLFQTPIVSQPAPSTSSATPKIVKKSTKKQTTTVSAQEKSVREDSDVNRINPQDFLSTDMICVKEEVVSDFEVETEPPNKTNSVRIQIKDPISLSIDASSSPLLEQSSNLSESTTTTSTMKQVPAANTGHISSKNCSPKDSSMDAGEFHDALLKENIATTTQPPKKQTQPNVSETQKTHSKSNVSEYSSASFNTGPFVCPYCLESHKPVSVLQTHLRLKHQSKPYFVCKCARVFARSNHLQDHTQFCSD